jgi:hypothetical protein
MAAAPRLGVSGGREDVAVTRHDEVGQSQHRGPAATLLVRVAADGDPRLAIGVGGVLEQIADDGDHAPSGVDQYRDVLGRMPGRSDKLGS